MPSARLALLGSIVVVATITGSITWSVIDRPPNQTRTAQVIAAQAAVPAAPISSADIRSLAMTGDTVTLANAARVTTATINGQDALSAARSGSSFLDEARTDSASLVYLSDTQFGSVVGSESDPNSTVKPDITNRLVWMFIFSNVKPISGGAYHDDQPRPVPSASPNDRMWIAIDATTGHFLLGRTVQ